MPTGLSAEVEYHVVNTLGWPDLRPLQRAAVEPVRGGADCLLLAPTAGGKTEAAVFPLLSEMAQAEWSGLSVLYVTPLRALLNNLQPRLAGYCSWIGRRAELWHGDVGPTQRRSLVAAPPDLLLTTPESLEAILVSTKVDPHRFFADVRAVVIDELHAFAGDDRGWHLLAVLERIQRIAGRRLQRVGLSATIGNPDELLAWMGGGTPASRAWVVAPDPASPLPGAVPDAEVTLDYVGSIAGAATVIAVLHAGEKRLVFCDSRAQCELLAQHLRDRGITTFVSHSSLSAEERRRSESAFAQARDCVVVATSTLELGIDVGDLDRVIQVDAPRTVASFLQRLGRTGRRPGATRNMLFLATREDSLVQAAALLSLWREGFVEPVVPPPHPRHITAQQLLALALQEHRFGLTTWLQWWPGLSVMDDGQTVLDHLLATGYLTTDAQMAFIGAEAEAAFGRRNFMELTAVFTAPPELNVVHGRDIVGSISPTALNRGTKGQPVVLALGGRSWRVTHVDWRRRHVSVALDQARGVSKWQAMGSFYLGARLAGAIREVLLGTDPDVRLSRRARAALSAVREERGHWVDPDVLIVERQDDRRIWWTFAGGAANSSISAAVEERGSDVSHDSLSVRWESSQPMDFAAVAEALSRPGPPVPKVDPKALEGLKFAEVLPAGVALRTLTERFTDPGLGLAAVQRPRRLRAAGG